MNPSTLVERWQLLQAINADPKLSPAEKTVAVAQLGFVNSKTGECFPSFEKIAATCHVCKRTVARATQAIESRGWYLIKRDEGGDRESNRYHFAFDRVRQTHGAAGGDDQGEIHGDNFTPCPDVHGDNFTPCPDVHGDKFSPSMVTNPPVHGDNFAPELEEDNSIKRTQSLGLFDEGRELPPPFNFEIWFEQFWQQYPPERRVEKAEAKKRAKVTIDGRRSDCLKASPEELMAGVLRYAGAMIGKDPQYIKHPTTWLNKGCWMDERADNAGRSRSASTEAVYAAGAEMAARSTRRRAAG